MKIIENRNLRMIDHPVGYKLSETFDTVNRMAHLLENEINFDITPVNFICVGSSGAIIAAMLYNFIKPNFCKIIHLKKPGESSHKKNKDHTINKEELNIFVDDVIDIGDTIEYAADELKQIFKLSIKGIVVSGSVMLSKSQLNKHLSNLDFVICQKWLNDI